MIEDKRLEKRFKNFKKTENDKDCLVRRGQEKSLQLRKEKLNEKIMKSRLVKIINSHTNKHEVKIENLNIESSFLSSYETQNNKIEFLHKILGNDNLDVNYIKYSLFQIRCIVTSLDDKVELEKHEFNEDLCSIIINYLLNYNDIQVKFESSWILICVTSISNEIVEYFINKSILKGLLNIMQTEDIDEELLTNVIWIFANLFGEDEEIRQSILERIPFHVYFLKILEKDFKNIQLKSIILFCFKNLSKNLDYQETYLINLIKQIIGKIVENYFEDKYAINDDLLNETLEVFSVITVNGNEYMINAMYTMQVYHKLINIIDMMHNYEPIVIENAITIIGNSFISENRELNEQIFSIGINPCFDKLIQNLKDRFKLNDLTFFFKKISWAIANILTTSDTINLCILDSKVMINLVDIANLINNVKINREVCIAIYNLMKIFGTRSSKSKLIMSTNVINYLCKVIVNNSDNDVLSICLDDIFLLLDFGENELESKIIEKDFEKQGIIDQLNKIVCHENKDISGKAEKILEMFWNDNK